MTIMDNESFFTDDSNGLRIAFNELLRGKILESSCSSDILAEESKGSYQDIKKDFTLKMPEHVRYFAEGLIDGTRFRFLHNILSEWLQKITK